MNPGGIRDGSRWSFSRHRENDHRIGMKLIRIPEGMPDFRAGLQI
jgi:hypothetical protein